MSRSILVSMLASLALVVGLGGRAFAGDYPYEPGGITVSTPDSWKTQANGDAKGAGLVTINADQSAAVIITVTSAKDLKKAQKMLKKSLAPYLTKPKMGKGKTIDLNGLKGFEFDGKAKAKDTGKDVGVLIMLLETPTHKALLLIGLAEADKFDANKADLMSIIQSIKPLSK